MELKALEVLGDKIENPFVLISKNGKAFMVCRSYDVTFLSNYRILNCNCFLCKEQMRQSCYEIKVLDDSLFVCVR